MVGRRDTSLTLSHWKIRNCALDENLRRKQRDFQGSRPSKIERQIPNVNTSSRLRTPRWRLQPKQTEKDEEVAPPKKALYRSHRQLAPEPYDEQQHANRTAKTDCTAQKLWNNSEKSRPKTWKYLENHMRKGEPNTRMPVRRNRRWKFAVKSPLGTNGINRTTGSEYRTKLTGHGCKKDKWQLIAGLIWHIILL